MAGSAANDSGFLGNISLRRPHLYPLPTEALEDQKRTRPSRYSSSKVLLRVLESLSVGTQMSARVLRTPLVKVRPDDVFFLGMASIAVIAVLIGFARSYFLAGMLFAPLPSVLVHIHAVAFLGWLVLFIAQIALVTTQRVRTHQRLGRLGVALAALMIVLGVLTATARVARQLAHPGEETMADVLDLYADPLFDMLMFVVFVSTAFVNRSHPPVHKRLMLFATFSLLDAGFDRWHIFDPYPLWQVNLVCFVPLVVATLAYDKFSTGRIQAVTLWSSVFLLATQEFRHFFSQTVAWASFSHWAAAQMPRWS